MTGSTPAVAAPLAAALPAPPPYPVAAEYLPPDITGQGAYDLRFARTRQQLDEVLALRFEVFNVTNQDNFIFVDTTLDPISVTYDTGNLATANRIVGEEIPLNFGQATATRDPRQIQLGIKLFID